MRGRGSLASIVILLAGCSAAISLPPLTATPDVVLDTYLRALAAGNCKAAAALATEHFGDDGLCGMFHPQVTGFHVLAPQTGAPADGDVVFALDLTTAGGDETMPDGSRPWFYSLHRQSDGRWLVTGGGSGP